MPAIKSSGRLRPEGDSEDLQNALAGVQESIIAEWNMGPRRVRDTALMYSVVRRNIKGHAGLECNLVIFYRIRSSAWSRKVTTLDLVRDIVVTPFFTDVEVTDENAAQVAELYSLRWNCENLYQKLVHVLDIIPSKDLWQRIVSFLTGLMAMGVYGISRVIEYGEKGEEARDKLERLTSFMSVARRDLENALDPPPVAVSSPPQPRRQLDSRRADEREERGGCFGR